VASARSWSTIRERLGDLPVAVSDACEEVKAIARIDNGSHHSGAATEFIRQHWHQEDQANLRKPLGSRNEDCQKEGL